MKQGLGIYLAALASPELAALLAALTFVPPSDLARLVVPIVVAILAAALFVQAWFKRGERRLASDFEQFREGLRAIVWEADPATLQFTWVSSGAERLLGYPAREWLGTPDFWATLLDPEDRERVLERLRQPLIENAEGEWICCARTADGRRLHVRHRFQVVREEGTRLVRLVGLMTPVEAAEAVPANEPAETTSPGFRQPAEPVRP
jgi:PAS domain-containing protein